MGDPVTKIFTLKITRPDESETESMWKIFQAADLVQDRWSNGSTLKDFARRLRDRELTRDERRFILRAWASLVDGVGGFGRLMSSFEEYKGHFQDLDVDYVKAKPELEQMAADAALLPVFEEAYREVMAIFTQPVVLSGSIARQEALNFRMLAGLISEPSYLKLYPGDDLQVLRPEVVEHRVKELEDAALVPGVLRCAKCDYQLTKTNLYMESDTTGPGDSKTEPCPNGCGPLWPETWKRYAEDGYTLADQYFEELKEAKRRIAELERITEGVDQLAIDGGWTARGMSEYTKTLESKLELPAVADVLAERQRQVSEKGYTAESDDSYIPGILCLAGAAYAVAASAYPDARRRANRLWPWPNAPKYFEPARKNNPRANLVKAAALIIAEIERIDRAAGGYRKGDVNQ